MNEILVSAIVSTYNSERFIKGCLDDLINQSLYKKNKLEIVVIDSASQQNEKKIVEEYQKRYPNIVYKRTEQRIPLYAAWNVGIKIAKGKYITNANTDDRHHPFSLELLSNELEKFPEIALVYPNQIITTVENETFENCTPIGFTNYPHFDRQYLLYVTYIGHQPMWRKSLHDEFGYFREDLKIAGDLEWWLRISEKYIFKHIPLLLGLYFYNTAGLERANSDICFAENSNVRKFYQLKSNKLGLPGFENIYPKQFYFKNFLDFSINSPSDVEVSVIFLDAHFNEETILSINSILNQTLKNFEVIALNETYSENKLQEFFVYDKRVKFLPKPKDLSALDAIHFAVSHSKGKYILFVNENIRFLPKFLETTIKPFSEDFNLTSVIFNFFKVQHKSKKQKYFEIKRELITPLNIDDFDIDTNNPLFIPLIIKRNQITAQSLKSLFTDYKNFINNTNFSLVEQPLIELYTFIDEPRNLTFEKELQNKNPRVSVVIAFLDPSNYLAEAIESVVNQTFNDWECIIVSDGSSNKIKEVVQNLILKYQNKKIYYYENNNKGIAINRNYGISKSVGEYILPLDANDLLHPTFLEKTVAILDKNAEVHIVYTDVQEFGEIENIVKAKDWNPKTLPYQNCCYYCGLFRKTVWEKLGGYNPNLVEGYEDWDFWIGAAEKGFVGYHLAEPIFLYRKIKGSREIITQKFDLKLKAQIILNHPGLYNQEEVLWAKAYFNNEKWALNIPNQIGVVPHKSLLEKFIPKEYISSSKVQENQPLVSVIIPTYNRPKTLLKSIASVINQTLEDFELIIVNDGGIEVKHFVESFKDPRIRYFALDKHYGVSRARNFGILQSKGKYIAYLDDDDFFFPNHLETLVDFLEKNPDIALAYSDSIRFIQERIGDNYYISNFDFPYASDFDPIKILFRNFIPINCIVHRKEIINVVGLFNEEFETHEDWEFWIRISRKFKISRVKSITCAFTLRTDGSSAITSKHDDVKRTLSIILNQNIPFILEEIEKAIEQNNLELAEKTILDALQIFDYTKQPDFLNDLAIIRVLQNNVKEALALWTKILEIDPNNELAKENLKALNLL